MMPSALPWLAAAVFAVSLVGTGFVCRILSARAILDHPNARSSHEVPTPRGAGWAVVPAAAAGWLAAMGLNLAPGDAVAVWLILAAALAALSWLDDLRNVSPAWRLLAQGVAVCVAIVFVARPGPFFGGLLPPTLDGIAGAFLWMWYVNLFNFMDGIDGIAGVETATTGAGIAIVAVIAGLGPELPAMAIVLAAAAGGFLWWNWQPARIFLGDIGSVPIGFLLGGVLLTTAAAGQWAPAAILPLYYLADATITLFRRGLRGERVWQAHRDHFYQQAVKKGASHARVSGLVLAADVALIGLAAAAAAGWTVVGLAGAIVVVALLLAFLAAGAGGAKFPGGNRR